MARSYGVEEFARVAAEIAKEVPKIHRDLQAELCGFSISRVVEDSPVLTGAYRASHTVNRDGGSGPGAPVYEGEDRVGDDEVVDTYPLARYTPASGTDAAESVKREEPFQRLEIRNGRFYASELEYGTSTKEPRAIYGKAKDATETEAARLAESDFAFGERF